MITSSSARPLDYVVGYEFERAVLADIDHPLTLQLRSAYESKRGALLHGPTGTGKTYAMVAAMRTFEFSSRAMFLDWAEFCADVDAFADYSTTDKELFNPQTRLFAWPAPLFVDDVGREPRLGKYQRSNAEMFDRFISARARLNQQLWITTNQSLNDFTDRYGERAVSRIYGHCRLIEISGDDRRLAS